MKIQCENCSVEHELDPPAWVVSSGRPFRFRCSSCGHSQMVSAQAGAKAIAAEDAPTPPPRPAAPAPAPAEALDAQPVAAPPSESSGSPPVYLKQEGKVYLVRDWATVQRWIMERRVDREDLVSEGGVRWEPIGNRAELGSFFAAVEQLEAAEQQSPAAAPPVAASAAAPPNPFANPFPFGGGEEDAGTGRFGRLDDDTEGVSMGLPPLPTEEEPSAAEEPDYPEQPAVRRNARPSEPALDPMDAMFSMGVEAEPVDLAKLRADTIPPDVAPPGLPPTPVPAARAEIAPPRPSAASALALADTVIHEPDDELDDPFAAFGKPVHAQDTAPLGSWEADAEPEPAPAGLPGWAAPLAGLVATLVLVVGGFALYTVTSGAEPHAAVAPPAEPEPELGAALPPPEPAAPPAQDTDAPAVAEAAEPAPEPVAVPEPAPLIAASVTGASAAARLPTTTVDPEKPPAERPVSAAKLVERGWTSVDRGDLAGAGTQFQSALGSAPNSADANFGYGYVLLKQGQNDLAQRHLCKALELSGGSSDIGREATGLIQASSLSCP